MSRLLLRLGSTKAESIQVLDFTVTILQESRIIGNISDFIFIFSKQLNHFSCFRQYYFNLTGSHHQPKAVKPKWQLLYQATAAYGIADLSHENMLSVYENMLVDPVVFDR